MRYLRVELKRYASRRAVRLSGALALLGILIASFIVFINSHSGDDAERFLEGQRDRFVAQCVEGFEQGIQFAPPEVSEDPEEFCLEQSRDAIPDPRFHLDELTNIFAGMSPLLMILALGLGATFIGAEWGAGTMTTYLTWEPRRIRAFVAKAAGALVFVFIAAIAVQIVLGLCLTPAAVLRGSTEGIDAAWVGDTVEMMLRSATLAAIFSGVGFALAAIARNTGASLTVGFVYFAILEQILRVWKPNWARWLVGENAALWLVGDEAGVGFVHSQTRAIGTLIAYATLLLAVGLALFRRRDVT